MTEVIAGQKRERPAIDLLASLLRGLMDTQAEPGLKSKYVKRFTFEYRRPGYDVEAGFEESSIWFVPIRQYDSLLSASFNFLICEF